MIVVESVNQSILHHCIHQAHVTKLGACSHVYTVRGLQTTQNSCLNFQIPFRVQPPQVGTVDAEIMVR